MVQLLLRPHSEVLVWLALLLCPPTVSGKCPRGAPDPPYIHRLGSVSSLLVPPKAHAALAFSEVSQELKWMCLMLACRGLSGL